MDYLCICECVLWYVYVNVFCDMYMWMCFVNCVFCLWICICDIVNCVFCCQLKGAEKSVLGGYHQFSSASVVADENTCPGYFRRLPPGRRKSRPHFRRPPRPTKIVNRPTIFAGLGKADENRSFSSVPTEIVAYFRRTYFRRLFSSVYAYFRGFLATKI